MVKVKICGIRRKEDIHYLNCSLPEFAGFIFAESRRKVSAEEAKALSDRLDNRIKKVGVFVNQDIKEIVDSARECSLNVIQLHGDENPEYISELKAELLNKIDSNKPVEIWKAIRVRNKESISIMEKYHVDAWVLDAFVDGMYGGAGKTFDWELAVEAKKYGKIILAGGLDARNIEEAIKVVRPYGVDVSSGVETDGYKDETKIKHFINAVRS